MPRFSPRRRTWSAANSPATRLAWPSLTAIMLLVLLLTLLADSN